MGETDERTTVETFEVRKHPGGKVLRADDREYPIQPIEEALNGERQAFFRDACRALYNGSSSKNMHNRLQKILREAINRGVVEPC